MGLAMALWVPANNGSLRVDFLDIGQGDGTLITTPEGRHILVDTGPDENHLLQELSATLPPLVHTIDILVLTHSDSDHISGARAVLDNYNVGLLLINQEQETTQDMQYILDTAGERRVPVVHASREKDIRVEADVFMDILTPAAGFSPAGQTPNNNSVVFMLITPATRILFTGDAEEPVEEALLTSGAALQASWLKGGHHGSKTSTSASFLQAVAPQTVIFENGKGNSYGHPSPEVMDRLAAAHIPVYNTSTEGHTTLQCVPDQPCIITSATGDHGP